MATEILIPKLGMTMTEGTVAEWYIPDNGEVKSGEHVYRLETEKIEFEVEAETAGTVRHLVPEGTVLPPGEKVGYILAPGEAMPAGASPVAAPAAAAAVPAQSIAAQAPAANGREAGPVFASPIARRLAKEASLELAGITGSGPRGRITEADVVAAKARPATIASAAPSAAEAPASPIARRLAEQLGVELRTVTGTGPGGRITKEDVEAAAAAPKAPSPPPGMPTPAGAAPPAAHQPGTSIPVRAMRKTIAERMHGSLQEMAQLTMGVDVAMDEAVKLRTQLVAEWEADGVRVTYTDLVIKAVAKALTKHPLLNATMTEREIRLLNEINIGMAVAVDDGLMVPVVRNANGRPLKEIAQESNRLALAARNSALMLDEMTGHTFSVTALGMFGVDFFTPIINPPNVAILGIGRIHDDFAWEGDRPLKVQRMTLSLTIDHRAVDGAPGAAFLGTVRELLEAPYRLLV